MISRSQSWFRSRLRHGRHSRRRSIRATRDVLLNRQDLGSTVTGITTQTPSRTRSATARTRRPRTRSHSRERSDRESASERDREGRSSRQLRRRTSSRHRRPHLRRLRHDPEIAARLATAYAEAFTAYGSRRRRRASRGRDERYRVASQEMRDAGKTETETYRELASRSRNLRTLEYLQIPASIVRPRRGAGQVAPTPRTERDPRRRPRPRPRTSAAHSCLTRSTAESDTRRSRARAPDSAPRETADSAAREAATILERAPDESTEASAGFARASTSRTRTWREDGDGHERWPERGQVDHDRESRRSRWRERAGMSCSSTSICAGRCSAGSSTSRTARASPTSPPANTELVERSSPSA